MIRRLFFFFFICGTLSVNAQVECEYVAEGFVYDYKTKEALPFVTVQIEGTTKGTNTGLDGSFKIEGLCDEEFHLVFTHLGYKRTVHHHDPHHPVPQIFLASDDLLLESVVVESGRIVGDMATMSSSSLSGKEFKKESSSSFAEAASKITGVSMLSTGQNIAKPIIHGLHSNRVLIVNNGVRHEFQNWGTDHAPEIDPSLYSSLEVVKGAGTVRYGPDALGGVILINPPKLELDKPLSGEVGSTFHTNGKAYENNFRLQRGFHRMSLQAQASYVNQGDLTAPDYRLSNTGKEELSYSVSALYHLPKLDLQVDYSRFKQDLGILRGSVTGNLPDLANAIERSVPSPTFDFTREINNPRQQVKHDFLKVGASLNESDRSFNVQYGYQKNFRREFDIRRGTNNAKPSINLELVSHTVDVDWKKSRDNGRSSVLGGQLLIQDNRNIPGTNTAHFVPNYDLYRGGAFVIEALERGKNTYEAGVRYDYQYTSVVGRDQVQDLFRNELNFQNVTLTFGYKRKVNEAITFSTNLGSAWRPPNVSELYAFGKHEFTIDYGLWRYAVDENDEISTRDVLTENDRPIDAEKGFKWTSSINYFQNKIDGEFTLFANYIENFINTRPRGITNTVRGAFPFFVYEQSDAFLTGADLSVNLQHNDKLSSLFTGSYLWAKDISSNSFFVGLPPANLTYEVSYDFSVLGNGKGSVSMTGAYIFRQFQAPQAVSIRDFIDGDVSISPATDAFDFLPPPPAFFRLNIYSRLEKEKFDFVLSIHNVLNNSYRSYTNGLRYYAVEIGRNISFSVNYKI